MIGLRAVTMAFRLAGPHWARPWESKLLRWRLETYGISDEHGRMLTADEITPEVFRRFVTTHRRMLWRFLCWAARLSREP